MKKLKMSLSGAELLNREQMKQIMGGFTWNDDGSGSGSGSGYPPPLDEHCDGPCSANGGGADCPNNETLSCSCEELIIGGESGGFFCA